MIAPPTMDIISTAEPSTENFPSPFTPKVKMDGNKIELNNPTKTIVHTETSPEVNIDVITSSVDVPAQAAITFRGVTLYNIAEPINLPTIASPQ